MGGFGSGRKKKNPAAAAAIAPAIETAPTTKSALLELPALEIPAGAGEKPDADRARAALESAATPDQPPAQSDSEKNAAPSSTQKPAGESSEKSSSAAAAGPGQEKKKIGATRESVKGDQYKSLKHEQLRALLAETKNELQQLRTEKSALEVVARGELANHLENAIAEAAHALGSGAAALWGQHMRLESEQASRLGKAWAPVVAHYMPDVVQHAPLVGAVVATSSIVLEKYALHKALVAAAQPQLQPREAP